MSYKIACHTLFDITQTGVLNRARPTDTSNIQDWTYKRNTQANFDTILQAVSLRAQPDVIEYPIKNVIDDISVDYFGYVYKDSGLKTYPYWTFVFEVHYTGVFEDGINELGALYNDCEGVPMIKCGTEWNTVNNKLDITKEYRNIYFIKY